MSILKAYKTNPNSFILDPISVKRDWMDETPDGHAYRCFPVTMANTVGWTLSCPVDVSFIWDGKIDTTPDRVKILSGEQYCYTGRGQGSVSFNTGLILKSEKNISVLSITPQNYFYEDFEVMSSLISTSFFNVDFPLAIKVKIPNKEITIKAGTPIATIIPISLTSLKDESIEINNFIYTDEYRDKLKKYGDAAQVINQSGNWTDWYRDAIDETGNSIGEHEVKSLKLKVIDNTKEQNNA
jgi:hypothetical protein